MKEIKFKAKRISHGEWVFGDLNQQPIHYDCQIIQNGVIMHSVDRKTVCQFTGLNDKNGVNIYEGDLLKSLNNTFKVLYTGASFNIYTLDYIYCTTLNVNNHNFYEVIGNIHDKK